MKQYLVVHRDEFGKYGIYSSYDVLENIAADMYHEFLEAKLGNEYVVIDTQNGGNSVVRIYNVERRIVSRDVGALETAWPVLGYPNGEIVACPTKIGDGATLLRFVVD